jgi:hypothetical protein
MEADGLAEATIAATTTREQQKQPMTLPKEHWSHPDVMITTTAKPPNRMSVVYQEYNFDGQMRAP